MTYTQQIEKLAAELNIDFSVAMDIDYLRWLEGRILKLAKAEPQARDFLVSNLELENQLDAMEDDLNEEEMPLDLQLAHEYGANTTYDEKE
jgi:hypothetical protein